MTSVRGAVRQGQGRSSPFDVVPVDAARDYSCEDADMTLRLRELFEPQLEEQGLMRAASATSRCRSSTCSPTWSGPASRSTSTGSGRSRRASRRSASAWSSEIYVEAGEEFNINSNPQLREILFEKLGLPVQKSTATGPEHRRERAAASSPTRGTRCPQLLMEYRELFKLEGTYLDALPALGEPARRAAAHVVQPDGGGDGPPLVERPEPAEHPDPPRARARHPARLRPAQGLEAARRRLLADRAAAARAPVAATRRSWRRSSAGGDIHRQTAAIIFGVPLDAGDERDARRARRRSTSRRSTGRARTRCRGSSRSRTPRRRSSSTRTSSASRA